MLFQKATANNTLESRRIHREKVYLSRGESLPKNIYEFQIIINRKKVCTKFINEL